MDMCLWSEWVSVSIHATLFGKHAYTRYSVCVCRRRSEGKAYLNRRDTIPEFISHVCLICSL